MRAACSDGSASASSNEFVWIDCAPPQTAESAWIATRTTFDSGCWAVSVEPPVCAWKRSADRARVRRAEAVAHDARPEPSRRPELRDLLEEVVVRVEEEGEPLAELVGREARRDRRLAVGDAVREREGELLRRARARLADVVAGDGDRVPAREPLGAVREEIGGEPHRRPRREDVVAARDVLLEHVVLDRAAELLAGNALPLGDELVEEQQERRRSVDRHRGRHLGERDPLEEHLHVGDRVDRDTRPADLALGERVVRVVAELRRQVERDREARLPALEQVVEAGVRLLRGAVSRRTGGSSTDARGTSSGTGHG